ncbi:hypothetical protein BASA81_011279 [Batrachochytrium salamandrivorans]|nr:hypothetical protein BASA81_011279 [Batrachochytrium salamandrivorans]
MRKPIRPKTTAMITNTTVPTTSGTPLGLGASGMRLLLSSVPPPPYWRPSPPEVSSTERLMDVAWKTVVVVLFGVSVGLASYSSLGLASLSAQRYVYREQVRKEQEEADKAKSLATDFVVKKE